MVYSGSNSDCKSFLKVAIPDPIKTLATADSDGKITFSKVTAKNLMGVWDIKISHNSILDAELATKNLKVSVSSADCEPDKITVKALSAISLTLEDKDKAEAIDLTKTFEISSTEKACKLTFALAWTYAADDYNKNVRTKSTITIDNGGQATVSLKASDTSGSNMIDGNHVFTISVKSILNKAVTGTNTLSISRRTKTCEVEDSVGSESAKGPFKHRIGANDAAISFAGAWAAKNSKCTFSYEVVKPDKIKDYISVSANGD